ncbi:MAG: VanZ family protein [Nitrospirae bacterium]|nr:VanZ family protein [Nitrospirota bacterium]
MKRFFLIWGPVILFAAFIFAMSSLSSQDVSVPFPYSDKAAHFVVYGLFAFLIFRGIVRTTSNKNYFLISILTVVVAVAYGMSDEFHQSFVPTRESDLRDIVADGTGAIAAVTILYIWRRFFCKDKGPAEK